MQESKLSKVKVTDDMSVDALLKSIFKALGSVAGKGGDLIIPAMGTHNAGLRKRAKQLTALSKSIRKSRPIKKRIMFQGMPINLEFLKGDTHSGVDVDGPWSTTFQHPYGEIAGTHTLEDNEPLDVYVGPNENAKFVYVIYQRNRKGKYDEKKVFVGFSSARLALKCFYSHAAWYGGVLNLEKIPVKSFKQGFLAAHRPELKKSVKAVPENPIDEDIAKHPGHQDAKWSKKFKKFGIDKLDVGTKKNDDIQAVYDAYENSGLPSKYFVSYPGVRKELHFEAPLKIAPSIKGYFADHALKRGKDGKIYLFSRAFDYKNKPYRLPGVPGLSEIVNHERWHFGQNWSLKNKYNEFMKLSGWTQKEEKGKEPSLANPKWSHNPGACFITKYAAKAPNEDWAETGTAYVHRPDMLKKKCPEKFKFFKNMVGTLKNKWWKKYAPK